MAALLAVPAICFFSCTHNSLQQLQGNGSDTVSFSKNVMPIFTNYCLGSGCHSSADAAAGLDLSTDSAAYATLMKKNDINTANPTQSFLYQTMNTNATPMPPSGRLSDTYVNTVLKWLEEGAKNN
jgi:hypothetical protein